MTAKEQRAQALDKLIREGEEAFCPVFGRLRQKGSVWSGYFALTEDELLIALLKAGERGSGWMARVPLNLRAVRICRMPFTAQYTVIIRFREGNSCRLLLPEKVFGLEDQKRNLEEFAERLKKKSLPIQ